MSNYSSPDEYSYTQLPTSRKIVSITEINQLHLTLRNRNVNTLTELRRIERTLSSLQNFAAEHMPEMTNAWSNYVNTNNLLSELRGLTRQYPFSSELLEDAKTRVFNDASSSRSWNFAWLILVKIRNE